MLLTVLIRIFLKFYINEIISVEDMDERIHGAIAIRVIVFEV